MLPTCRTTGDLYDPLPYRTDCSRDAGKKAPALTVSQVRWLLDVVLPLKTFTLEDVLRLMKWTQQRNHGACLAHRRRREEEG